MDDYDIRPSDVADIQRMYKEHFDIDLDYETAYRELTKLVRQMELVYRPITNEQVDALADIESRDGGLT